MFDRKGSKIRGGSGSCSWLIASLICNKGGNTYVIWLQPVVSSTRFLHLEHRCHPACLPKCRTSSSSGQSVPGSWPFLQRAQVHRKHCAQYRLLDPKAPAARRYREQVALEQYVRLGSVCSIDLSRNRLLRSGFRKCWTRFRGMAVRQQRGGKSVSSRRESSKSFVAQARQ